MGNPLDPDYDPKGYKGGRPGRRARPKLEELIGEEWAKCPGEMELKFAATGLGLEEHEIPPFDTNLELQLWVFRMHSLRGSKEHFQELGDRYGPKPSRLRDLDSKKNTRGATRAATSGVDAWFGDTDGAQDVPPDDDADLL